MFILVTATTLWGLLIYGSSTLKQTISPHSLKSLTIFLPTSWQGALLWFLWIFVIVAVPIIRSLRLIVVRLTGQTPLPTVKPRANLLKRLGGFNHMRAYLVFLLLSIATGVGGWILGITSALMFGTILAFGLIGNMIEQA